MALPLPSTHCSSSNLEHSQTMASMVGAAHNADALANFQAITGCDEAKSIQLLQVRPPARAVRLFFMKLFDGAFEILWTTALISRLPVCI